MVINLPATDGTYTIKNTRPHHKFHDIAVSGNQTGTLAIRGKKNGADNFESIPDGTVGLSDPVSLQVEGVIEEYEFTLSGVTGTDDIVITDTSRN